MEIKESTVNVEAVKSQLLHQKTLRARFRWPVSQKYAEDLLLAAYMAEVEYRQTAFVDDSRTRNNIAKVASHLVNPKKFGLMLAGTCGNGDSVGAGGGISYRGSRTYGTGFIDSTNTGNFGIKHESIVTDTAFEEVAVDTGGILMNGKLFQFFHGNGGVLMTHQHYAVIGHNK